MRRLGLGDIVSQRIASLRQRQNARMVENEEPAFRAALICEGPEC
jgi:hypothetical protein